MTKINKTADYSIFKKHESNRQIDSVNLKKIIASIKTQNMLQFRPILVDVDMRVIDGQHRLEAAKQLGVEVYYQVNESSEHQDIILLNANQKRWTTQDYIDYYISRGNQEYKKLKDYAEKNQIKPSALCRVISANAGRSHISFKKGNFKFCDEEQLAKTDTLLKNFRIIQDTMLRYVLVNQKCIRSEKMREALLSFLKNPAVEMDVFVSKIMYKSDAIKPCTDTYAYYCMLRDIYNWKNQNPIE